MTTPAVQFDNVTFAYAPGAPPAIEGVSISVAEGEFLAVVGPNGGGKSTFLKLMLGLLRPSAGEVRVNAESPEKARAHGVVGWVPQRSGAAPSFPASAREVVRMAASWRASAWRPLPRNARERADEALGVVGASDFADQTIGRLSGGQFQRVMIARAIASGATILALDEPTVGIDAVGQQQFASLLKRLHKDLGLTVLLVSHDLRTVAGAAGATPGGAACDRVACLRRRLHFHAAPKGITPQVLAQVFEHDLAGVFGDVHVDAHRADECADHTHTHAAAPTVALGIDAPRRTPPPTPEGRP